MARPEPRARDVPTSRPAHRRAPDPQVHRSGAEADGGRRGGDDQVLAWLNAPGPRGGDGVYGFGLGSTLVDPRRSADIRAMSQQLLTASASVPSHYHIWRVALTGRAAFMSRPYPKRDAARPRGAGRSTSPGGWFRSASSGPRARGRRGVLRMPVGSDNPRSVNRLPYM